MPTVALSVDFLNSLARIPLSQQKKVREFTEKFRTNPKAPSINYEKIHGVKDKRVRTVRISLSYRAIVLHPETGDVYVLVWVDHHDEAMAWAKDKSFEINPSTGALQVYSVSAVETIVPISRPSEPSQHGLLPQFSSKLLLSFGVPRVLIPTVRAVRTKEEMLALTQHIPTEAAEALIWLSEGVPPDEVRAALRTAPTEKIDTEDFDKALQNPDTRRRFTTVESQYDLSAMLDAPLEKWRVFLHPSQVYLVNANFSGPALVLGGAGTGKTIVAMHRAKYLASRVFPASEDRVLFVTYSINLAKNVEQNVKSLCGSYASRIEVTNLHSWAVGFMRGMGAKFEIVNEDDLRLAWQQAVEDCGAQVWDVAFIRQEWERIVRANDIRSKDEYLRFSRVGSSKALPRPDRARIWQVFERFQEIINASGKCDWLDVIRDTRIYLEKNKPVLPYRAVVVDETQDLHPEELRLIRRLVREGPNDLFMVGDAHQRIYDRKSVLGKCGIDVLGRISRLNINYRTTEQIRDWAVKLLGKTDFDNLDGGSDDLNGYISLLSGPTPEVSHFETAEAEGDFVKKTIRVLLEERSPENVCIVARSNAAVKTYKSFMQEMSIPFYVLGNADEEETPGIRLSTMHRIKGLEFPCILLAGMNDGVLPRWSPSFKDDATARTENDVRERCLLFVAATRARDRLIITSFGSPSPFLRFLPASA
ncbi:MAG: UvrD/REP helicase [Acidobacteria bacterium]|nr:UvrD/REP helicase [Acidobacteriota bacterium]